MAAVQTTEFLVQQLPLAVITAMPDSGAALFVQELASRGKKPALFLVDKGEIETRSSFLKARIKKIRKRGIVGPLLSRRLIRVATGQRLLDGRGLCAELGVEVAEFPSVNHPDAVRALASADVEQALSLGNRYIRPSVLSSFGRPIFNLHHGKVPEFRGGPPVFWEVHDGLDRVGFTVHRIDEGIDTGPVVIEGSTPIIYSSDLTETIAQTWSDLFPLSIRTLVETIDGGFPLGETATPQSSRGTFRTSPRLRDVMRAKAVVRAKERDGTAARPDSH